MSNSKPIHDKWYGEESAYTETDEILINDSIPVFDRGDSYMDNPHYGLFFADDFND